MAARAFKPVQNLGRQAVSILWRDLPQSNLRHDLERVYPGVRLAHRRGNDRARRRKRFKHRSLERAGKQFHLADFVNDNDLLSRYCLSDSGHANAIERLHVNTVATHAIPAFDRHVSQCGMFAVERDDLETLAPARAA